MDVPPNYQRGDAAFCVCPDVLEPGLDHGPTPDCCGPCVKECGTHVCGPSNCPGDPCGECLDAATTCVQGACETKCDWAGSVPSFTWGPAGVVSALKTPDTPADIQTTCFDYTGDGLGDNGLKGLSGQINGPLATLVDNVTTAILFELAGVTDFTPTPSFHLNGLMGKSAATPPTTTGDFRVLESSYVTAVCAPMIQFRNASIAGGTIAAGPSEFQLSFPVSDGVMLDATILQAKFKADITVGATAAGFAATNGVLSGILTKQELETALARLQATCDAAPANAKPDFCSYLKVATSAMNLLFDLHQVGDGTFVAKTKELPGDAASLCLTFTLSQAKITGFAPAAAP
jgi:hypothetical protein